MTDECARFRLPPADDAAVRHILQGMEGRNADPG
jgi:hypothetical protein